MQVDSGPVTLGVFRLLARLFPYRPPADKKHLTLTVLKPQFARWEIGITAMLFVFAPLTIWLAKLAFDAGFPPPPLPAGALAQSSADRYFYFLPAILLGLVLAAAPVMFVARVWLGTQFADYLHYGNLLVGFDTVKIWKAMSIGVLVFSAAVCAGAGVMRLTLFPDHLELRRFARARAEIRPYTQIAAVTQLPSGPITIAFTDGSTWSTTDDLSIMTLPPAMAGDLARRVRAAAPPPAR